MAASSRLYSTVGLFSISNNYPCPEFCMSTRDFFVLYLFRLSRFSPPIKVVFLNYIEILKKGNSKCKYVDIKELVKE